MAILEDYIMPVEFFDLDKDTHSSFVERYNSNDLALRINTNAAGFAFQGILKREYGGKQAMHRTFYFGGLLVGFIAIFFVGWWSLIGFLVGFIGLKSSRAHTNKSVIQESLKNPAAYEAFVKAKILAYES